MTFKSIFSAYRVNAKPGVKSLNNQDPNLPATGPQFTDNENADPLCDEFGSQWVRDASDPRAFLDSSNENLSVLGTPQAQVWSFFPNFLVPAETFYFVGQEAGGNGRPAAIYNLVAMAGAAPAIPLFLQVFTPNNGVAPINGAFPAFSMPIPALPDCAKWSFTVKTPLNGVSGLSGGFAIAASKTGDVYTAPLVGDLVTFQLNVNWAFYTRVS